MVQVDVFWSYALGSSFAFAASRQLASMKDAGSSRKKRNDISGPFVNIFFVWSLVYASCLFAPSGAYLLWEFPSWETMHVWDRDLSSLLLVTFAVTNVTQSILGFWVTYRCIRAGNPYAGFLQVILGYFCMFFILVHGWDGTGYRRFFSATKENFLTWDVANLPQWFTSDVAVTLYVMGVFLIPLLFFLMARWLKDGYVIENAKPPTVGAGPGFAAIFALILLTVFGCALCSAITFSLLIHFTGWIIAIVVFTPAAYFLLLRRKGLFYLVYRSLLKV